MKFNNKEIEFYITSGVGQQYGSLGIVELVRAAMEILDKHPVDMLVFEPAEEGGIQVRLAGYYYSGERQGELEENEIVARFDLPFSDTFWLKIDDLGDSYVGTFLYPREY